MLFIKQKSTQVTLLIMTLCSHVMFNQAFADTESEYQKNVAAIGKQIDEISRNLNANKALLKNEQDELLGIEQEISSLREQLEDTESKISSKKNQDEQLLTQIENNKQQQKEDLEALTRLLVSRYTNGKSNYMQMLLNQQNPYAVGRLNNYYEYFSEARQKKITALREQLADQELLQQEHTTVLAELERIQQQQKNQQRKLDQSKQTRQDTVNKLNSKVASSAQQLDKLKQDRSRLNTLLKEIAQQAQRLRKLEEQRIAEEKKRIEEQAKASQQTPVQPIIRQLVKGGFIKQQGRLSYPVNGSIKYKYNSRLPESGMRSEGVFFDTKGSVQVKSIFRGRVLFADFLKGYGLLLIIDHGDDHISLYGHNEVLYKKVGDSVETNEVVAKTGVTGGLKSNGLYFEVRNNATPIDPAKWWQ